MTEFLPRGTNPLPYLQIGMNVQKTEKSIVWRIEDILPNGPDYNDMMVLLVSNDNECKLYCESISRWTLASDYNPSDYKNEKLWLSERINESRR